MPTLARQASAPPVPTFSSAAARRIRPFSGRLSLLAGVLDESDDVVSDEAADSAAGIDRREDARVGGRQTDRVLDAQRPYLERLNSMAGLRRWRDRLVSLQGQRGCVGGCPIGSLASQLVETNPGARQDLTASFTRWEAYLVEGLTDMRSRGRLRPDADPHALAEQVMTAVQGGLLLAQTRRSTRPLELALDMALAHVDSHLAGRPRAPASAQER